MSSNQTQLNLETAYALLKQFDCAKPTHMAPDRALLRQALLLVAQHSDYQMLGICAEAIEQGKQALRSYTRALGYNPNFDGAAIEGAVYIKFNPRTGKCYADAYKGDHRGVLVSCQSAYDSGINDIFGHLPIDLFDDG